MRAAVAALALALAAALPAWALVPGGGAPTTDCLVEFGGTPPMFPAKKPREIRCVDNDPTCDGDPDLGACQFQVSACLNVTDPALPLCGPVAQEEFFVENEQPDTNPLHDFDFQALEDQVTFGLLPLDASQQNVCSSGVAMSVYLPIRIRNGSASWTKGRKILRTEAGADTDKLRMRCLPAPDITPCDGVTSTFDQIQQMIFHPTSCGRSTCHNVQQGEHDLSLAPGEAYANLVGVTPANFVAASAGKQRVDPGHPENSFLLDKVRGTLLPGEGVRMPYGLKKLPELTVRILEEWIAAGAPATGFVSPTGCQP